MFFVMLNHRTVSDKRIITFGSDTVEMPVGFVVMTMWSATVHISIKKLKSFHYVDKAMEIFCMKV